MQEDKLNIQEFYNQSVNQAIQFLESNYTKKIILNDIAEAASLSPFHFHRIFKSFTNQTTKQFLTRIRLESSAHLLQHTTKDIGQIAYEVGYDNPETFARAFKNYFQVTASSYRQNFKSHSFQKQETYQNNQSKLEDFNIQEPIIKYLKPLNIAYMRHNGSYKNVGKTWSKLMFWAMVNFKMSRTTTLIGISYDNPDITQEYDIRYDACIVLKNKIKSKKNIYHKEIEGGKYLVFCYKGSYENLELVYDYIYKVILSKLTYLLRNSPILEFYINSPIFHKPQNYVTDIYIPIE